MTDESKPKVDWADEAAFRILEKYKTTNDWLIFAPLVSMAELADIVRAAFARSRPAVAAGDYWEYRWCSSCHHPTHLGGYCSALANATNGPCKCIGPDFPAPPSSDPAPAPHGIKCGNCHGRVHGPDAPCVAPRGMVLFCAGSAIRAAAEKEGP